MSPANDPMTFDELSELYRVEMRSPSLTQTRRDLFRAMANLLTSLRQEYDRQASKDPDSVMAEGADQRRKKADRLCKDVVVLRTTKIANMAIRGAEGGRNTLEALTDEERAYYDTVVELTRRHLSEVDRLRGRIPSIETRIDEPPVRRAAPEPEPEPEPVPEPEAEGIHEVRGERPPEPEPAETTPEPESPPADGMPPFDDEPFEEPFDGFDDIPDEPPYEAPAPEAAAEAEELIEGSELEPILIRVLEDLPPFAGPDRDYALSKEDLVTLPRVLADVLVNSGKAALVRPTP